MLFAHLHQPCIAIHVIYLIVLIANGMIDILFDTDCVAQVPLFSFFIVERFEWIVANVTGFVVIIRTGHTAGRWWCSSLVWFFVRRINFSLLRFEPVLFSLFDIFDLLVLNPIGHRVIPFPRLGFPRWVTFTAILSIVPIQMVAVFICLL